MNTQSIEQTDEYDWDKLVGEILMFLTWTALAHFVGVTLAASSFALGLPHQVTGSVLVIETGLLLWRPKFVPTWIITWADAMRFRRKWNDVWESIAKTNSESTTFAAGLIPVLNPLPRISGGTATWVIRPPRGRTLEYVADQVDVIAAQNSRVDSIAIDYRKITASKAKMIVVFGDALEEVEAPTWR